MSTTTDDYDLRDNRIIGCAKIDFSNKIFIYFHTLHLNTSIKERFKKDKKHKGEENT
jgi:hypothetical protein